MKLSENAPAQPPLQIEMSEAGFPLSLSSLRRYNRLAVHHYGYLYVVVDNFKIRISALYPLNSNQGLENVGEDDTASRRGQRGVCICTHHKLHNAKTRCNFCTTPRLATTQKHIHSLNPRNSRCLKRQYLL